LDLINGLYVIHDLSSVHSVSFFVSALVKQYD